MGQFITPPTIPLDTYCRRILIPNSPEWIGTVTGALLPLIYSSEWVQTTGISPEEAASRALEMFNLYVNSGNDGECGDMACCGDQVILHRFDPVTGRPQVSKDGGTTWTTDPADTQNQIPLYPPLVTEGGSKTKCDAATNASEHFNELIDAIGNQLSTAGDVFALAVGVAEAVLALFLILVSGGALSPLVTAIATAIWAAGSAAFALGHDAYVAYWTTDKKDAILCALYCNIGDDGQFTEAQYQAVRTKIKTTLPASAALDIVMTSINAGGARGLSQFASYGNAADADCSSCDCGTCACSLSEWVKIDDRMNEPTRDNTTCQIHQEAALIAGNYYIGIKTAYPHCCLIELHVVSGGTGGANLICGCDYTGELSLDEATGWTPAGLTTVDNLRGWLLRSSTPFEVYWSF